MHEDPVDAYLAGVARQLAALPADERDEELRELRQHLDALVAGYRATGLEPEAAARAAVERFGEPERIGRGLRKVADRYRRRADPALRWKRALVGGVTVTMIHAVSSLSTADDGSERVEFAAVLSSGLVVTALISLGARAVNRRRSAR